MYFDIADEQEDQRIVQQVAKKNRGKRGEMRDVLEMMHRNTQGRMKGQAERKSTPIGLE